MEILVVRIRQVEINSYAANWWFNVVRGNICFYDLQEDGLRCVLAQGAFRVLFLWPRDCRRHIMMMVFENTNILCWR